MRGTTLALSFVFHALVFGALMIPMPASRSTCDVAKERLRRIDPTMTERQLSEALPECAKYIRVPTEWMEIGLADNLMDIPTPITPPKEATQPEPPAIEEPPTQPDPPAQSEVATPPPQEADIIIPDEIEVDIAPETTDQTAPPEPEKTPDPAPEPEPEPTPEKKTLTPRSDNTAPNKTAQTADDDFMAMLDAFDDDLDQQPSTSPPQTSAPANAPAPKVTNSEAGPQLRQRGAGKRTGNTLAMQTAVRQKIDTCWDGIDGLPNPDRLDVMVQLEIQKSGFLISDPKRIEPRNWPVGDRHMLTAIERALRAARKCEPYDFLPIENYNAWKTMRITIGVPK